MHKDILLDIGLTKSEIAVYFSLLKLGSSTTGPIIKKAQIASGRHIWFWIDCLIRD